MKYYAIRNPFKKIVTTWPECQSLVKGVSGVEFKSFKTKNDAINFINSAIPSKTSKEDQQNVLDLPYIGTRVFIDGSFNAPAHLYGGSAIFLNDESEPSVMHTIQFHGNNPQFLKSQNIAGEIGATIRAIDYAINQKISALTIIHDYEGIAKWANGSWRTDKTPIARAYHTAITNAISQHQLKLKFVWVKGHTGVTYNELCDKLAKEACGIKPKK